MAKLLLRMAVALPLLAALGGSPAAAAAFPDVSKIERDLIRGVSTKDDVRTALGLPDGVGESVFPPDHRRHRIWFYQDMEITDLGSGAGGAMKLTMRQQLLMIFFDGDAYDGFTWTSNVIPGAAK